jgi:adenylylsulfate kinase
VGADPNNSTQKPAPGAVGRSGIPGVIWITGLSGAGKTTLAERLRSKLIEKTAQSVVLIDGDAIRRVCGNDLGFSEQDRVAQISRMQRFAQLLADQGVLVLVAALYANRDLLEWNKTHLTDYFEVYIKASLPALRDRDYKGVYKCPEHVVGVDIPWTEPWAPDLVIDGDRLESVEIWAESVLSALERKHEKHP